MPLGASSGRRPAATIRKPGDLTERRTSPTCADRMGGLRRRGPSGRRVVPPEEECEDWSSPARYWRPSSRCRSAWQRLSPPRLPQPPIRSGQLPLSDTSGRRSGQTARSTVLSARRPTLSSGRRPRATTRPLSRAARAPQLRWTTSRRRLTAPRPTRRRPERRSWRSSPPVAIPPASTAATCWPAWPPSTTRTPERSATVPPSASRSRSWGSKRPVAPCRRRPLPS